MADGHLNSCKDCRKGYQRTRPYDKEYERQRNQTEKRKTFLYANASGWRRENPQKMAVQLARRRARKLDTDGDFTVEEFEALCEKYGNACLCCGDRDSLLTPDHVVPLSLGGSNRIANVQPLCGSCNSWKNTKTLDYRPDGIPSGRSKQIMANAVAPARAGLVRDSAPSR